MTTVLVTGGNGYIGSHCIIALLDEGCDVINFDNNSTGHKETADSLSKIKSKGKIIDSIYGDLLNIDDLNRLFDSHKIDSVIHFAAFSQVGESMRDPKKYYRNNIVGTMNLLDSMISHGVKKIVFSSTAATYGEPDYVPIDETHPQRPINPYGLTKLCIEHMMDDYDAAYGLKSVRLRYFNVSGADSQCRVGEWHEPETHLIPNILKSTFGNGQEFNIFGNDYPTRDGTCIRDYINVEDLSEAHVLALHYLDNDGTTDYFNLGTNEGSSVKEVITECEKVTGTKIPMTVKDRRAGDPAILVADNKKAKAVLGWEPRHTLADSIRTAYDWEKKRREIL